MKNKIYFLVLSMIFLNSTIYSDDYLALLWNYYNIVGSSSSYFYSVKEDYNHNIVACGKTNLYSNSYDIFCIKLDENGSEIWSKQFGHQTTEDIGNYILPLEDNTYVLTGIYQGLLFLAKLDHQGNQLWIKNYYCGAPGYCIVENNLGGFIVVSNKVFYTDSLGNLIWEKNYSGSGIGVVKSIYRLENQHYLLSGDNGLIIIIESGAVIWESNLHSIRFNSAIEDCSGNYIATGDSSGRAIIKCITPEDSILWTEDFSGSKGYEIIENKRNEYCVVGDWWEGGFLAKYNSSGVRIWFYNWSSYPYIDDLIYSVDICDNSNIVISGSYWSGKDRYTYRGRIRRFENVIVGINENQSGNTFNNEILVDGKILKLSLNIQSDIILKIYDVQGRLISEPFNEILSNGEYSVNLSQYRSGVYFYNLQSGNIHQSGKFLILD